MTAEASVCKVAGAWSAPRLVDPFPIRSAPHTPVAKLLAARDGLTLPPQVTCDSALELARLLADGAENSLPNAFLEALAKDDPYRDWKRRMPPLKDVPELRRYRNEYEKHDPAQVQNAISRYGMKLPAGQMLFHGGPWPPGEPKLGQTYTTTDVLSTSLCPQISSVHARYSNPCGELWALRVASDGACSQAFVFNNKGNQKLKHEHEVLLSSGANLQCVSIWKGKTLLLVELELS